MDLLEKALKKIEDSKKSPEVEITPGDNLDFEKMGKSVFLKKDQNSDIKSSKKKFNKSKLKTELRKLIHCVGSGHKLYTQLGYKNIIEAKARIQEIIDQF